MRLHRLTVTAFGPFAGTEDVDLDELTSAGVFLLTGPTGAGKTSLLDAVCFALYGTVPGARGTKELKSHHADPQTRPEVVLELSVRGRRFRLRRSPEWSRPKRRGEGTTTEHARATLVELVGDEERLLSSRAQEVGHLVGDLVGMQSTQFVQVAMLPQGEFQRFLRATSQERHEVLEQLFGTARFARIEEWVHDHSRALRSRHDELLARVRRVLDAAADRCACDAPDLDRLLAASEPDDGALVTGWLVDRLATARGDRAAAAAAAAHAQAAADGASTRLAEARRTHELRQRHQAAARGLRELEDEADVDAERRARLETDRRAAELDHVVELLDLAAGEATTAREVAGRAAERLRQLPGHALSDGQLPSDGQVPDPACCAALAEQLADRLSQARGLLPHLRERDRLTDRLDRGRQRLAVAEGELERAAARAEDLPRLVADARDELAGLDAVASQRVLRHDHVQRLQQMLAAATEADRLERRLPALRDTARDARDRAADQRDRVQELTARRLAGMAAELAGRLTEGAPCQVCGSTDHPRRAEADVDAVTDDLQQAAEADRRRADEAHEAARAEVVQVEERLASLRELAGDQDPEDLADAVARAETELERAGSAEEALPQARRRLEELGQAESSAGQAMRDAQAQVVAAQEQLTSTRGRLHELDEHLATGIAALCPDTPADQVDLERLVPALEQGVAAADQLREAVASWHGHQVRVAALEQRLAGAAVDGGFATVADLRAARLPDPVRSRLEAEVAEHHERLARARAVLEDPDVAGAAAEPAPDLAVATSAAVDAQTARDEATRDLHRQEDLLAALERLTAELTEATAAWLPVRAEWRRADEMARLVRGTSPDNQLQIRLSAYVLARRLDQVTAAANERLARMRDQRYVLQRSARAHRRNAQAGLGLEVVDQWTGEVRSPTTLSGGETFMVSLALALGLADVVSQEAGGIEIQTLFVDEGFGTLDPDALDDVMDRLDELRAGGRSVGVVSHVAELRSRIPAQLHVDKTRAGSVLSSRVAVG